MPVRHDPRLLGPSAVVVAAAQPAQGVAVTAREPAKCGTAGGYAKHKREHTKVCPGCREAWRVYQQDRARVRAHAANEAAARWDEQWAEEAARAEREAPVLGAHHAGDLVLG